MINHLIYANMFEVLIHPEDQIRYYGMYTPPGSLEEYYCIAVWLKLDNKLSQAKVEQYGKAFVIYVDATNVDGWRKALPEWWPSRLGVAWERKDFLGSGPFVYTPPLHERGRVA